MQRGLVDSAEQYDPIDQAEPLGLGPERGRLRPDADDHQPRHTRDVGEGLDHLSEALVGLQPTHAQHRRRCIRERFGRPQRRGGDAVRDHPRGTLRHLGNGGQQLIAFGPGHADHGRSGGEQAPIQQSITPVEQPSRRRVAAPNQRDCGVSAITDTLGAELR